MSNVAVAEKIEIKEEPPKVLKRTALQSAEFAYARMSATLPAGWTIEDAMKPEFWVQVSDLFQRQPVTNEPDKAGAIIELRTVDHAFYAELYVRAVPKGGLVVQLLREPVYLGRQEVKSDNFRVQWNVGKRGFDVVRNSDREIVASGLATKDAAQAWIDQTVRPI